MLQTNKEQLNSDVSIAIANILEQKLNAGHPGNMLDMANALETISTDIYSDNNRFIYELIQNADDSAIDSSLSLQVQIIDDFFILSHNGKPFTVRDLQGLCSVGSGGKTKDTNKIGYKGIGFKSVFNQNASLVYVKSMEALFKFDRAEALSLSWCENWGEIKEWEDDQEVIFKAPWQNMPILTDTTNNKHVDNAISNSDFDVHTIIKLDDSQELIQVLHTFFEDTRFLLFLRNISEIKFINEDKVTRFQKESDNGLSTIKVDDEIKSTWLMYSFEKAVPKHVKDALEEDSKLPEKFKQLSKAEISFAFQVKSSINKKTIVPLIREESFIYTYLPTTVDDYEFPFLVNSNFIVDAGREKIRKDNKWNQWLFELTGFYLVNSCQLMHKEQFKIESSLKAIKKKFSRDEKLCQAYNKGLELGMSEIPFVVNNESEQVYLRDIVIESVGLLEQVIIEKNNFIEHLNTIDEQNYKASNVLSVDSTTGILISIGAKAFRESDFTDYLQQEYFKEHHVKANNEALVRLISKLDSSNNSNKWKNILKDTPTICSNNNELVTINSVYFPISIDGLNEFEERKFIDNKLYDKLKEDELIIGWLKKHGVTEPSKLAYLEKEIIPHFDTINESNYIDTLKVIIELHEQGQLKTHHYSSLKKLPLKSSDGGFNPADGSVYSPEFNPTVEFTSLHDEMPVNTINKSYLKHLKLEQCKSILNKIGVIDSLIFESKVQHKSPVDKQYLKEAVDFARYKNQWGHRADLINEKYAKTIKCDQFVFYPGENCKDFLNVFWNNITSKHQVEYLGKKSVKHECGIAKEFEYYKINNNKIHLYDTIEWGYKKTKASIPSYFQWWVKSKNVIPTTHHGFTISSDVLVNKKEILELVGDDLPIIKMKQELSDGWVKLLGLKSSINFYDGINLLFMISQKKEGVLTESDITRIDRLYFKILEEYKALPEEVKNALKDLKEQCKLNELLKCLTPSVLREKFDENTKCGLLCIDGSFQSDNLLFISLEKYDSSNVKQNIIHVPDELRSDSLFRRLLKDIFNVKVIDEFELKAHEMTENKDIKYKLLHGMPYIYSLATNKNSKIAFDEYIESLTEVSFNHCEQIELTMLENKEEIGCPIEVEIYKENDQIYFSFNINNLLKLKRLSDSISQYLRLEGNADLIFICLQSSIEGFSESCKEECPNIESIFNIDSQLEAIKKYDVLDENTSSVDMVEMKEDSFLDNDLNFTSTSLSQEGKEDASTLALFDAINYLESKGIDIKSDESNIEQYKLKRKIINIQDEKLPFNTLLYRSVKNGELYLSYPAWRDFDKSETALYMSMGKGLAPVILNSKKELLDYATNESMLCSLHHNGALKHIEDLINGNFIDRNYADLPKLNFILKVPQYINSKPLTSLTNNAEEEFNNDELQ